jgi:hypothetical protein
VPRYSIGCGAFCSSCPAADTREACVVGTLRLTRYTLYGVLLLLVALAARLAWAVHEGVKPPSWMPRVKFGGFWGVHLDFSQPTPPDAMRLLLMDIGGMIMVFAMVLVLVRFERKEREAAIALRLPPPSPVRLTAVETSEPERRLTLTERLERRVEG